MGNKSFEGVEHLGTTITSQNFILEEIQSRFKSDNICYHSVLNLFYSFLIHIQQDATLHRLFYLETALHVSGGTTTHHQERKQLYLQHLVFGRPLLLPAAIVEGLERSSNSSTMRSNSSTITADNTNGVTNTRCCRYSCMRS
jgi:hypothetical protein